MRQESRPAPDCTPNRSTGRRSRTPVAPSSASVRRIGALLPSLLLVAVSGGCASSGGGSGLTVRPAVEATTWEREASTELSIDAGGQVIPVRISERSLLTARFRPEGGATRVSVSVDDFDGRMTNPMAPEVTATEAQIDGSAEFLLDDRGRPSLLSLPTTSGGAAQLFDGWGLVHGFVPRFPEGGAAEGDTWTDTISYAPEGGGMTGTVHQVVRYSAAGDSLVDGRRYRVIRAESDDRVEQRGATGGMQIAQTLEGTSIHLYLWDEAAGFLHSAQVESTLSGSMNVDAAPMPLGVSARGTSTLVRR